MDTKNSLNEYSEYSLSTSQAIQLMLEGKDISNCILLSNNEVQLFNTYAEQVLGSAITVNEPTKDITVEELHLRNSKIWNFPTKYKQLNMRLYLEGKCSNEEELERVNLEYSMFEERGLVIVLQFFVFLVEHMRLNNIFWGVGRGSSVASFCLYLIGIHRINSIKYELDINEFLK